MVGTNKKGRAAAGLVARLILVLALCVGSVGAAGASERAVGTLGANEPAAKDGSSLRRGRGKIDVDDVKETTRAAQRHLDGKSSKFGKATTTTTSTVAAGTTTTTATKSAKSTAAKSSKSVTTTTTTTTPTVDPNACATEGTCRDAFGTLDESGCCIFFRACNVCLEANEPVIPPVTDEENCCVDQDSCSRCFGPTNPCCINDPFIDLCLSCVAFPPGSGDCGALTQPCCDCIFDGDRDACDNCDEIPGDALGGIAEISNAPNNGGWGWPHREPAGEGEDIKGDDLMSMKGELI